MFIMIRKKLEVENLLKGYYNNFDMFDEDGYRKEVFKRQEILGRVFSFKVFKRVIEFINKVQEN